MRCELCNSAIEQTFLGKIKGTTVKNAKGKMKTICSSCQEKFPEKEQLLAQLK